jgi:plastocyanin
VTSKQLVHVAAVMLLVALMGWPAHAAAQGAGDVYRVRVVASERGFDPPVVDVPEGQLIELTFVYGDTHLHEDNPHVMFIEGLNIESGEISRSKPETTVRFTAEKSGRIRYVCKLYCTGHERMQDGILNVRPIGAGGGAAVAQPVNLRMAASSPDVVGARVLLRAELGTTDGTPLEGITVRFEQQATLVTPGWVTLGTARTDGRGAATLEYLPFGTPGDQPVRAVFEGSARYEPAAAAAMLKVAEVLPAWHAPVEPRFGDVRYWLLVAGVGGVWLTLGYVGSLMLAIRRAH